jgi:hypothetical protein
MTAFGAPLSAYRTPGVRLEWLDAAPQSRTLVRTDIAGFAGIAERGPLHRPTRVDGWDQFRGVFGDHLPDAYLAYAVEGFFAGGGSRCWVVRVADPVRATRAGATLPDAGGNAVLDLAASSPGAWGNRVTCRSEPAGGGLFTLILRLDEVTEIWRNLSPTGSNGRDPVHLLNDQTTGSRLVTVVRPSGAPAAPAVGSVQLTGGSDGLDTLTPAHFVDDAHVWGVSALDTIEEVALVSVPDLWARPVVPVKHPKPRPPRCDVLCSDDSMIGEVVSDADPPARAVFSEDEIADLQREVLVHCERQADRVALLDSPQDPLTSPAAAIAWRGGFDSAFGALYYPWLLVVNPLSPDANVTPVPASGHIAGVCARVDTQIGVHKPPANELVALAVDTVFPVDPVAHGDLNDANVNAIRVDRGVRVLGDRTLTRTLPEWTFLNVRRLVLALEEQIVADTVWTVFEPNSPRLWGEVDRVVRGILDQAWQRGMLVGATRDQAYSVRCDATTNPPSETAVGRLTALIGLNPPPPAEFVVIRVIRTPSGISVVEGGTGG